MWRNKDKKYYPVVSLVAIGSILIVVGLYAYSVVTQLAFQGAVTESKGSALVHIDLLLAEAEKELE